jgi:hypothetical protein
MKPSIASLFLPVALMLAATPVLANDALLLDEAREIAASIPPKMMAVLQDEVAKGGPEGAIGVCREKAPKMAQQTADKTGWSIRRVSLKHRSSKAVPDAWERAALLDFDQRNAAGESPGSLEKGEIVTAGGVKAYRYMVAIPTQKVCASCHGKPDDMSTAVKAKLGELYPEDKAIGYGSGEIRGALSIKRAL